MENPNKKIKIVSENKIILNYKKNQTDFILLRNEVESIVESEQAIEYFINNYDSICKSSLNRTMDSTVINSSYGIGCITFLTTNNKIKNKSVLGIAGVKLIKDCFPELKEFINYKPKTKSTKEASEEEIEKWWNK